jgi:dihydroorotate dehydrogenase|tara:strand:- start:240 stop:1286 length:1047 start_codon:yes stop_codon:yes gene_type:complete
MFSILRPYIFSLDPEVAHELAIKSLKFNFIPESFFQVPGEDILETNFLGIKFKNPIGLAAGFDKSAEVYNSLYKFGFGFVEVGTITPRKQLGNPKPRMFRLEKDKALINRLGFNNDGLDIISKRISSNVPNGILGINIGPNKDTKNKINDFSTCLLELHSKAHYITINISSPNTEGLRDFHEKDSLSKLLDNIVKLKKNKKIKKPLFLKISPDIGEKDIEQINELIFKYHINGIILSNTTDSNRNKLEDTKKNEKGGLSGLPLRDLSTKIIRKFYQLTKGRIPIIGVGGVDSGESAFEKISAGANAVQLYTGMIYNGPGIVKKIKKELIDILKKEKIKNIDQAVGINS